MAKGIIVASFGTSYEETRRLNIESIEQEITRQFSDYVVNRAFTSRMILKKLKTRDALYIDNEIEALEKMRVAGMEEIYIQPLHVIPGFEYEKLTSLEDVVVGKPLLYSQDDYEMIVENLPLHVEESEALVFMGHGSEHEADERYKELESVYREHGIENVYFATVEGDVTLQDVMPELKSRGYDKIILQPFMIVAGDHAQNDMASDDEDSWKSILLDNGFTVEVRLIGLGQYETIRDIFVNHLRRAIEEKM